MYPRLNGFRRFSIFLPPFFRLFSVFQPCFKEAFFGNWIDWGIYEYFAVIFPPAFRTFTMLFKNPGWSAKPLKER